MLSTSVGYHEQDGAATRPEELTRLCHTLHGMNFLARAHVTVYLRLRSATTGRQQAQRRRLGQGACEYCGRSIGARSPATRGRRRDADVAGRGRHQRHQRPSRRASLSLSRPLRLLRVPGVAADRPRQPLCRAAFARVLRLMEEEESINGAMTGFARDSVDQGCLPSAGHYVNWFGEALHSEVAKAYYNSPELSLERIDALELWTAAGFALWTILRVRIASLRGKPSSKVDVGSDQGLW
ncbi:hypothetical protein Hte_009089 [Hypoxylon texense]